MKIWEYDEINKLIRNNDLMVVKTLEKINQLDWEISGFLKSCFKFYNENNHLTKKQIVSLRWMFLENSNIIADMSNGLDVTEFYKYFPVNGEGG